MTRCPEFYQKWSKDPNWCEKCNTSVFYIDSYLDLIKKSGQYGVPEKFTMMNLPERAARPLFEKRNADIREKAIEAIFEALRTKRNPLNGRFLKKWTVGDINRLMLRLRHNGSAKERQVIIDCVKPVLKFGDFRELIGDVAKGSVSAVVCDPNYAEDSLPLWHDLAVSASRVLKPSGFLIAYSGLLYLPKVLESLSLRDSLEYYWLFVLHFANGNYPRVWARHIFQTSKAVLVYQKPPFKPTDEWVEDFLVSPSPDKDLHEHGQNIEPILHLLKYFTHEGDTVLDPFAGGGSTIEACLKLKRNVMAFEIDRERYDLLLKRFGGNGSGEVS